MKRIGIISDTHGTLPEQAVERLRGCDVIIHAGDICAPAVLYELQTVAPVRAVLGNNDYQDYGTSVGPVAAFAEEGVRFVVVHEPRHLRGALASQPVRRAPKGATPETVVAVHGHTHVPVLEQGGEGYGYDLKVCPGAVFRPRSDYGRTLAILEVEAGEILSAKIISLSGEALISLPRM